MVVGNSELGAEGGSRGWPRDAKEDDRGCGKLTRTLRGTRDLGTRLAREGGVIKGDGEGFK